MTEFERKLDLLLGDDEVANHPRQEHHEGVRGQWGHGDDGADPGRDEGHLVAEHRLDLFETERNLDLLLGDALAENDKLSKANAYLVNATAFALAEAATFKKRLKYQDDREGWVGTHSPECWTFGPRHYECALRHINSMTDDGK